MNPVGPRGVYDEAKRFGEALTMAYRTTHSVNTGIVRIFNTYGPRMRARDGRAIPTFIRQAITCEPITVSGDGSQTRSVCYVDDLIAGVLSMAASDDPGPINLGNPSEISMLELAMKVKELATSPSEICYVARPIDDPQVRCPDISRAINRLGWKPEITLPDGLSRTISWFVERNGRRGPSINEGAASRSGGSSGFARRDGAAQGPLR